MASASLTAADRETSGGASPELALRRELRFGAARDTTRGPFITCMLKFARYATKSVTIGVALTYAFTILVYMCSPRGAALAAYRRALAAGADDDSLRRAFRSAVAALKLRNALMTLVEPPLTGMSIIVQHTWRYWVRAEVYQRVTGLTVPSLSVLYYLGIRPLWSWYRNTRKLIEDRGFSFTLQNIYDMWGFDRVLYDSMLPDGQPQPVIDADATPPRYCLTCTPSIRGLTRPTGEVTDAERPGYEVAVCVPARCAVCSMCDFTTEVTPLVLQLTHDEGAFITGLINTRLAAPKRNVQLTLLHKMEDGGYAQQLERSRLLACFGGNIKAGMGQVIQHRTPKLKLAYGDMYGIMNFLSFMRFCAKMMPLYMMWAGYDPAAYAEVTVHPRVTRVGTFQFNTWTSQLRPLSTTATPGASSGSGGSPPPPPGAPPAKPSLPKGGPSGPENKPGPPAPQHPPGLPPPPDYVPDLPVGLPAGIPPPPPGLPPNVQPRVISLAAALAPTVDHIITEVDLLEASIQEHGGLMGRVCTSIQPNPRHRELGHPGPFLPLPESERWALFDALGPCHIGVKLDPGDIIPIRCPPVGNPCIYSQHSVLNRALGAAERMICPPNIKFAPEPALAGRRESFKRFLLAEVFTKARISKAVQELGVFEEFCSKKLTEDRVYEIMDEIRKPGFSFMARTAIVKREATAKPSKPPRCVQDAGLEQCMASVLTLAVFEHVLFSDEICGKFSIKHKDKETAMRDIATEFMKPVMQQGHRAVGSRAKPERMCGLEIDQTRFEFHQRLQEDQGRKRGLLDWELSVLDQIWHHLRNSSSINPAGNSFDEILSWYLGDKMTLRAKKPKDAAKDPNRWNIITKFIFRASGDRGTSSLNFLVELGSLLCIVLADPTQPIRRCMRGEDPAAFYQSSFGMKVFLRAWTEGDDFCAKMSASILPHIPEVERLFTTLGLEAKIVTAVGTKDTAERLEFTGYHFALYEGRMKCITDMCPDISRAFITSSPDMCISTDPTATPCALLSKAIGFAASLPDIAGYFYAMAHAQAELAGGGGRMSDQDAVRVFGKPQDFGSLQLLYDQACAEASQERTREVKMVACSVKGKVTAEEWGAFVGAIPSFTTNTPAMDIIQSMPAALRAVCMASFK
nr:MAG: RNA-dependent RNA polymerase [Chemarfal virus 147]